MKNMLQLGFLLLTIVCFVTSRELTINNYVINIENDILKSVQPLRRASIELNLSGLGLRQIENDAFSAKIDAYILNLGNNYLTELPESIFSNLTQIEHILLFNNEISRFKNTFIGLSNLQSLNISNNPIESLLPGEFYGLSKSVNIFLSNTSIDKMSASVFENSKGELREGTESNVEMSKNDENSVGYAMLCMYKDMVYSIENRNLGDTILGNCKLISFRLYSDSVTIELNNMGITGFIVGWYDLKFPPNVKVTITFMNNAIEKITKNMLNDLPPSVTFVSLMNNTIKDVYNGTIHNRYLKGLDLSNNGLRIIEPRALHGMDIVTLYLDNNNLKSVEFVKTLPSSIQKLHLMDNNINELPAGAFTKIWDVRLLNLVGNNITILKNDTFKGLEYLSNLQLSLNEISEIEKGAFNDLQSLAFLHLRRNELTTIDRSLFEGTKNLAYLDISDNKLTKVMADSVPKGILSLNLEHNQIEYLEPGCFSDLPLNHLSLEGNKITNIPKGIFYSKNRKYKNYDLERIRLGLHHLSENMLNGETKWLSKILSTPFKAFSSLDLTENRIRSLMNGAFYGIPKEATKWIFFARGQIQHIQGGLFDNV